MLVDENLFGKVTMSALSFSYTDEYDEDLTESSVDFSKEDDFEAVEDDVLDEFDDDIYGDEIDEEDKISVNSYGTEDFDDDIYGDETDTDDAE